MFLLNIAKFPLLLNVTISHGTRKQKITESIVLKKQLSDLLCRLKCFSLHLYISGSRKFIAQFFPLPCYLSYESSKLPRAFTAQYSMRGLLNINDHYEKNLECYSSSYFLHATMSICGTVVMLHNWNLLQQKRGTVVV